MVFEKVCEILAMHFGIDRELLTEDTSFVEDIGADSLDLAELMLTIEDEFDVGEITEEEAASIHTVGDLVHRIGEE